MVIYNTPPPLKGGHRAKRGIIALLGGVCAFVLSFTTVLASDDGTTGYVIPDVVEYSAFVTNPNNVLTTDLDFGVVTGASAWVLRVSMDTSHFPSGAKVGYGGGWKLHGNSNGFINQKVKFNWLNENNGNYCYSSDGDLSLNGGSATSTGTTQINVTNGGSIFHDNCQASFFSGGIPTPDKVSLVFKKSTTASIEIDYIEFYIGYEIEDAFSESIESGQQTSEALDRTLDFYGWTPVATSQMHCEVIIGQICTDSGIETTHNNAVARVVMNASDSFTTTQSYGDGFTYNAYGWGLGLRRWDASFRVPLFINSVCSYPQSLICTEPDGVGGYTVATASSNMQSFVDNPSYYPDVDWALNNNQIATYSSSLTNKVLTGEEAECNLICQMLESIRSTLTKVFVVPAFMNLEGWEGVKNRLLTKFPFGIMNTITNANVGNASTSATYIIPTAQPLNLPITSFKLYNSHDASVSSYLITDNGNLIAQSMTVIRQILSFVIWGYFLVYCVSFIRRWNT